MGRVAQTPFGGHGYRGEHLAQFFQRVVDVAALVAIALTADDQLAFASQLVAVGLRTPRTSSLSEGLASTSHRSTALLATLLTFCPPGPELRTNDHWNSDFGIRT